MNISFEQVQRSGPASERLGQAKSYFKTKMLSLMAGARWRRFVSQRDQNVLDGEAFAGDSIASCEAGQFEFEVRFFEQLDKEMRVCKGLATTFVPYRCRLRNAIYHFLCDCGNNAPVLLTVPAALCLRSRLGIYFHQSEGRGRGGR